MMRVSILLCLVLAISTMASAKTMTFEIATKTKPPVDILVRGEDFKEPLLQQCQYLVKVQVHVGIIRSYTIRDKDHTFKVAATKLALAAAKTQGNVVDITKAWAKEKGRLDGNIDAVHYYKAKIYLCRDRVYAKIAE